MEMKGSVVSGFFVKESNIVAVEIKGLILTLFLRKFVLFTIVVYKEGVPGFPLYDQINLDYIINI